jgi:hypothetical protein
MTSTLIPTACNGANCPNNNNNGNKNGNINSNDTGNNNGNNSGDNNGGNKGGMTTSSSATATKSQPATYTGATSINGVEGGFVAAVFGLLTFLLFQMIY